MVSHGVRGLDPSARPESQVVLSRMLGEVGEEMNGSSCIDDLQAMARFGRGMK